MDEVESFLQARVPQIQQSPPTEEYRNEVIQQQQQRLQEHFERQGQTVEFPDGPPTSRTTRNDEAKWRQLGQEAMNHELKAFAEKKKYDKEKKETLLKYKVHKKAMDSIDNKLKAHMHKHNFRLVFAGTRRMPNGTSKPLFAWYRPKKQNTSGSITPDMALRAAASIDYMQILDEMKNSKTWPYSIYHAMRNVVTKERKTDPKPAITFTTKIPSNYKKTEILKQDQVGTELTSMFKQREKMKMQRDTISKHFNGKLAGVKKLKEQADRQIRLYFKHYAMRPFSDPIHIQRPTGSVDYVIEHILEQKPPKNKKISAEDFKNVIKSAIKELTYQMQLDMDEARNVNLKTLNDQDRALRVRYERLRRIRFHECDTDCLKVFLKYYRNDFLAYLKKALVQQEQVIKDEVRVVKMTKRHEEAINAYHRGASFEEFMECLEKKSNHPKQQQRTRRKAMNYLDQETFQPAQPSHAVPAPPQPPAAPPMSAEMPPLQRDPQPITRRLRPRQRHQLPGAGSQPTPPAPASTLGARQQQPRQHRNQPLVMPTHRRGNNKRGLSGSTVSSAGQRRRVPRQ